MKLIVSFDGGGLFGVWPATIMQRVWERVPDLHGNVELYCGTSTGGLIALGLANEMHPREVKNIYLDHGSDIFKKGWFRRGIFRAKYDNVNLHKVVKRTFGTQVLGDLSKRVLIPTFDTCGQGNGWKPKFFHNYPSSLDEITYVSDIAMCTSAAPVFFPTYHGFIDGGVVANNPSFCGVAQLVNEYGAEVISDVNVLSIGTGHKKQALGDYRKYDEGVLKWAWHLVNIFMDGTESIPDYFCKHFLDNYLRVDPEILGNKHGLDDPACMQPLVRHAESFDIEEIVSFLRQAIESQHEVKSTGQQAGTSVV